MNVNTIVIPPEIAKAKLDEYRSVVAKQRTEEDQKLHDLYRAVVKGARVINILEAFKMTGLNELGQPRLAIARASAKRINFMPSVWMDVDRSNAAFTTDDWFQQQNTRRYVALPKSTFGPNLIQKSLRSAVPHIPPSLRPKSQLENYHILFEVEKWEEYPVDPFLLRRIDGYIYVVEAEWELGPLEASLLSSIGR